MFLGDPSGYRAASILDVVLQTGVYPDLLCVDEAKFDDRRGALMREWAEDGHRRHI